MVWDKLTGEPLHNAISNKMTTLLLNETVTSNVIPALFPPYTTPFLEGCCIIYCTLNGFV